MSLFGNSSDKRDWAKFGKRDLSTDTPREVRLERIAETLRIVRENRDATSGMTEAKRAAEIDDANRREPWAKRVAGGRG